MTGTRRRHVPTVLAYAVLVAAMLAALFPLYWTFATSLKTRADSLAVPPKFVHFDPTLDNYRAILGNPDYVAGLANSLRITSVATVLAVVAAGFAAYGLARRPSFPGRRVLEAVMILVRGVPIIVLAVPMYSLAVLLRLYDSWWVIACVIAAINLPYATWMLSSFIRAVPVELEQAARTDGAGQITILFRIVLPLILPGLAATVVFTALLAWNEFLIPLVLSDQAAKPFSVFIGGFVGARIVDWGPLAAASTLAIVPVAILTLAVQRWLVAGLSLGAVNE